MINIYIYVALSATLTCTPSSTVKLFSTSVVQPFSTPPVVQPSTVQFFSTPVVQPSSAPVAQSSPTLISMVETVSLNPVSPTGAQITIESQPSSLANLSDVVIGVLVFIILMAMVVGSTVTVVLVIIMKRKKNAKGELSSKDHSNSTYDSKGEYLCATTTNFV